MSAVSLADVLDHLVARSGAASSFGGQLDRARLGIEAPPDPFRARAEAEDRMLQQATLLRCIDAYAARTVLPVKARILEKIQRESKFDQGYIGLVVLRAYQEWSTQSPERGLIAIQRELCKLAKKATPPLPSDDIDELVQLFREGKAAKGRNFAAEAYADAYLAMQTHLKIFNRTNAE